MYSVVGILNICRHSGELARFLMHFKVTRSRALVPANLVQTRDDSHLSSRRRNVYVLQVSFLSSPLPEQGDIWARMRFIPDCSVLANRIFTLTMIGPFSVRMNTAHTEKMIPTNPGKAQHPSIALVNQMVFAVGLGPEFRSYRRVYAHCLTCTGHNALRSLQST